MRERYQKFRKSLRDKMPFFIIFVLILMFLCAYLYTSIVITIRAGEAGVLYRRFFGGTVVDRVFPEGIHLIFPWDTMFIYNVRIQQISHEFYVLTKNGLRVHLSISIRYYPEYDLVGVLHKKIGPNYVETVVIPEIEAVLRMLIGRFNAQEVYTTDQSIIEESLNDAIEQVAQRFVLVDDVLIKKIELPLAVDQAIQDKIKQKHLAEAYVFRIERQKKESERKRIEAKGMRDYNKTVNESLSGEVLQWMAIQAALELSKSENAKVVIVGSGAGGLPIFGSLALDAAEKQGLLKDMTSQAGSSGTAFETMTSGQTPLPNVDKMPGSTDISVPTGNASDTAPTGTSR